MYDILYKTFGYAVRSRVIIDRAASESPALSKASLSPTRVALFVLPLWSPGVHWSHSSSITPSQLFGASLNRSGFAWI